MPPGPYRVLSRDLTLDTQYGKQSTGAWRIPLKDFVKDKTPVQADDRNLLDRTLWHLEALVITSSYGREIIPG